MFDEAVEKILKSLDESVMAAGYPKFSGKGYRAYRIDAKNFHEIKKGDSGRKIAFVDGGNAEIISSAGFSLNVIRVCYVLYQNNRKIGFKKFEIIAFIHAISKDNEIHYKASFFDQSPMAMNEMSFSSLDYTLMLGTNRAEISSVANAIRRFAELMAAKSIADRKIADFIVLDGNLQSTVSGEKSFLDEAYESCANNNVVLAALSKTSSLFTDNGSMMSVVLGRIGPSQAWNYHPVADISSPDHRAEMFFAKFHEKSKHVFRLEIFNQQKAKSEEIINILAANCKDPIFIGYPYGMVEADRIARVGNSEKESLRTMILVKLKNKNIESYLNSGNAHEILDRISF
ncbi:DNA double-strand break repair nuclease NurA [Candidatus Woesearchaeota archaeon]|nr:DNA double-strand break repair nuclease NurA [Candidatus Woesearchaeota archaeon]